MAGKVWVCDDRPFSTWVCKQVEETQTPKQVKPKPVVKVTEPAKNEVCETKRIWAGDLGLLGLLSKEDVRFCHSASDAVKKLTAK